MSVKITIKDDGAVKLMKILKDLNGMEIAIGFQGAEGGKTHPLATVNVATIALYNEFGTIDSPARPFMRTAIFEGKDKIARLAAVQYGRAIAGKSSPLQASSALGAFVAKLVQERIDKSKSWAVPNALATVAKKGHTQPLIGGDPSKNVAGGTMRNAITWSVKKGGIILATGKPA